MRRLLAVFAFIFLLAIPTLFAIPVNASSQQAYQDYLYQLDVYRQAYTDFQVAKNEYEKFKSLTSQTSALTKTIAMLTQRDVMLKTYLFLLNEKLNEDRGLSTVEKQLYQTLISSEVTFLNEHAGRIPSIGSLEDATDVSQELESHYNVLHASMRRIITGIYMGTLAIQSRQFDTIVTSAKTLINTNRGVFTGDKQAIIDRWVLQIDNKRTLYQQKINSIVSANNKLTGSSIDDIDRNFTKILKDAGEAKQYLTEATSYLTELVTTLKYQD